MNQPPVFHFGATETILFDLWKIDCGLTMVLSMAVILIVSCVKEFLRVYRSVLPESKMNAAGSLFLFAIQTFLGFSLMAIFMLLNVWLCLAVVIGEVFSNLIVGIATKQRYELC
uniref:Copper transport protein n=1 Tax=Steinernema glaseri TaxID=37863 RepID=A0A1I7ZGI3_9BILA